MSESISRITTIYLYIVGSGKRKRRTAVLAAPHKRNMWMPLYREWEQPEENHQSNTGLLELILPMETKDNSSWRRHDRVKHTKVVRSIK
jgi:hypothetical protein